MLLIQTIIIIIIVTILPTARGDAKDCGTTSGFRFYRRMQCISKEGHAAGKAREISEIYTEHKRREGVVKVFRCKLFTRHLLYVWERPTSF